MSESTMQSATELASQYSVQVTDDLERNVKEQERVSAEITALQQQLAALQHDHALLVNMQQALGITSPPQSAAATEAATVPAPRGGAAPRPATGKATRSKKATTAPKRAAASKTTAKKAAGATATTTTGTAAKTADKAPAKTSAKTVDKAPAKTAAKSAAKTAGKPATKTAGKPAAKKAAARDADRPTLVELVREHLAGQREPRSAAEVTTALGEAHSGRTVKTTVVRTTLEGLVAKNQAQRTKQGTSVYYTATEAAAPEPKQDAAAEAPSAPSGS
ncbi:BlaI/MecI/CopY family transcriptional regulator OS=Streptomyces tendae OX=1932 GN=GUR47_05420 PE=4 SV=1 [Streptomyces tendae]